MTVVLPKRAVVPAARQVPDPSETGSWHRARDLAPLLPIVAIGLVVVLLGVLIWYVNRDEREAQQLTLIKDALWVEQTLRFHLTTIEENVERLGGDLGRQNLDPAAFSVRAGQLIRNEPPLYRVLLRDAQGRMIASAPLGEGSVDPGSDDDAILLARKTGRRVFSRLHALGDGGKGFDIVVPIFDDTRFLGSISAVISLAALLNDQVPWWITERHRVSFLDESGTVIAAKSSVTSPDAEAGHTLAFDTPGLNLYLSIVPYGLKTNLVHNSLIAAILVLAMLACVSLFVAHRHMRRRIRAEELSRLQTEKLARTSRLVAMGEMASTLAHELNQPLSAIASYATGCLNKLDSGKEQAAEMRTTLEKLGFQAQRAGRIIQHVHEFVRKNEPKFGSVDLSALVADTVEFIRPAARKRRVVLAIDLGADLPMVHADRVLLEQVLLNLIRNGFEAMAHIPAKERVLAISVARRDDEVAITVADCGSGIAPEVKDRLFTPFVSTKPDGMGMGLNICRSIVESHRGRLWLEPRPDRGTVFTVALPVPAS